MEIAVKLKCDVNLVFMSNIYVHYNCTWLTSRSVLSSFVWFAMWRLSQAMVIGMRESLWLADITETDSHENDSSRMSRCSPSFIVINMHPTCFDAFCETLSMISSAIPDVL